MANHDTKALRRKTCLERKLPVCMNLQKCTWVFNQFHNFTISSNKTGKILKKNNQIEFLQVFYIFLLLPKIIHFFGALIVFRNLQEFSVFQLFPARLEYSTKFKVIKINAWFMCLCAIDAGYPFFMVLHGNGSLVWAAMEKL